MATCYRSHQKKLSTKLITRFDFFTYDPIENIYIPIEVHILYRATDFILVSTRGLCTPECGYRWNLGVVEIKLTVINRNFTTILLATMLFYCLNLVFKKWGISSQRLHEYEENWSGQIYLNFIVQKKRKFESTIQWISSGKRMDTTWCI